MEYVLAFQRIIMPIAYEFNPELVLVSAGFDAAIGDPLGGCKVTPEAYGYFTHWLSSLAAGRIILCLEGGYNVNSVAYAMTMCAKALLGDPMPVLQHTQKVNGSCIETIQKVLSVQQKYWKSLRFGKKLPNFENDKSPLDELARTFKDIQLVQHEADGNAKESGSARQSQPEPGPSSSSASGSATASTGAQSAYFTVYADDPDNSDDEQMYGVYPLTYCPHLSELATEPDEPLTCEYAIVIWARGCDPLIIMNFGNFSC